MQRIAIDVGYGDVKVCTKDRLFKFPTAIERVGSSIADFGGSEENTHLFNGKEYKVGEKVMKPVSTRSFNFLVSYAPLLIYHSIQKAGLNPKEPIELITGLSIANWEDKEEFLDAISTINVDNILIKPKIKLMAQGQGIFKEYQGDKEGLVCVVDIGFNTLDFLVFDDGMPEKKLSFATTQGANIIITKIQSMIQRKFKHPISEQEAKTIFLDNGFSNFGTWIDLKDEIDGLKEEYSSFILNELRSRQVETLRKARAVIFSGGGAYFLEGTDLPKNTIFSKKPYEFANVRGYYGS